MLTVLNVAYPFAPVGPNAVGGAEQMLWALEAATRRAEHRSLVLACEGSRVDGSLHAFALPDGELSEDRRAQVRARVREAIERIVASESVDLVHMHGVDFHQYLPAAPVPVLATLHVPCTWYPDEVFALERPRTYLNCVSNAQRRQAPAAAARLLDVVPNGVDLARFRPGTRGKTALVLGRVCAEKGIHFALDAARRADVSLDVAGPVLPYAEPMQYFRQEIEPRLDAERRFIGAVGVEQKAQLLASARCAVVPSMVEDTSSIVALEALACGVPVIGFRVGALPELIDDGRTGFLVDDVEQMAAAIKLAPSLDSAACRAAAERFPLDAMCWRYMELYSWITR